jgi:nicotinamidase/pyrazinamidase
VKLLVKEWKIGNKDALIIADIQVDFLSGGALPVKEGDQTIPVLNEYAKIFKQANAKIIASRDWHPPNHISFKAQGGPWPPHCVQDTEGAKFDPLLKVPTGTLVVSKATNPAKEAYSVFDGTDLAGTLKSKGVTRVFVGGLATDYCVVNTVLDARKLGLDAVVLVDATRGINVEPGDADRAIRTMVKSGAEQATLTDFPEPEALKGEESMAEVAGDKPLSKVDVKKTARMRSKGAYKRLRRERG